MTDERTPDVDAAYGLDGPQAAKRLYEGWAETYDHDFAAANGYRSPGVVAAAYAAAGGAGPVLDMGAGTGLVGEALAHLGVGPVDATDLSPGMLEVARGKGVYRELIAADVLRGLPLGTGRYAGVVSAGTFTHGHVGPEALDELLRVAAPGALFVLTVHEGVFGPAGFEAKLTALRGRITGLSTARERIYAPGSPSPHADDKMLVVTFRKAP
ncbi:MAG: class I SAM-dependent DNA methyltransferase [Rhodosalinus sp.]